jgi:hypothetical protein
MSANIVLEDIVKALQYAARRSPVSRLLSSSAAFSAGSRGAAAAGAVCFCGCSLALSPFETSGVASAGATAGVLHRSKRK